MNDAQVWIRGPEDDVPARFEDAYRELLAISAALKPSKDKIPDVDKIEPLVQRAKRLAAHCQARIEAVRGLVDSGT